MQAERRRRLALLEAAGTLPGEVLGMTDEQLWEVICRAMPGQEIPDPASATEAEIDAFLDRVARGRV